MFFEQGIPRRYSFNPLYVFLGLLALALLGYRAVTIKYQDLYTSYAIGGTFLFYLRLQPGKREWLGWLLAVIGSSFLLPLLPIHGNPAFWPTTILAIFGLASFATLIVRATLNNHCRQETLAVLWPAAMLAIFNVVAQHLLNLAEVWNPKTLDLYLFSFDASLGFLPSFWIGSLFAHHAILRVVGIAVYVSIPLFLAFGYASYIEPKTARPSWYMMKLIVANAIIGWLFYNLFPAAGPLYVFRQIFPFAAPAYEQIRHLLLVPIPLEPTVLRNAMPSLHLSWVVLIWWNSEKFPRWARMFVIFYLAFTIVGTLGTGEHYLVDLVGGYAFALFIQALFAEWLDMRALRRYLVQMGALGVLFALMLLLRYDNWVFWISPLIPWSVIGLSIAAVTVLKHKLFLNRTTPPESQVVLPEAVPVTESVLN